MSVWRESKGVFGYWMPHCCLLFFFLTARSGSRKGKGEGGKEDEGTRV